MVLTIRWGAPGRLQAFSNANLVLSVVALSGLCRIHILNIDTRESIGPWSDELKSERGSEWGSERGSERGSVRLAGARTGLGLAVQALYWLQCESHLELFSAGVKMSHHSLLSMLQFLCGSVQATNCCFFLRHGQHKPFKLAQRY